MGTMSFMDSSKLSNWSKRDIISIIKECRKNNVSLIKVEGLELTFQSDSHVDPAEVSPATIPFLETPSTLEADSNIESDLDMLMITDPVAFEIAREEGALDAGNAQAR